MKNLVERRVKGGEIDWSDEQRARRPVREYLAALDSENTPANPNREPKALSPTDPSAAWTSRGRHKVMFGYSLNYLMDTKESVIVDVEATPTRISKEVDATETHGRADGESARPQARVDRRR